MQSELKPCPLCQSDNVSQGATLEQSKQHGFVRCFDCGCSAPIAAWDTRASDAEITRLTEALRAAEEREKGFVEALIWCSGSADFNEGGQAREGWLKLCRPLIDAALKGPSHDA